jgi:hypothetical protein
MSKPNGQSEDVIETRVHIVIPSHDYCPMVFAYDLASMYGYTVGGMPEETQIGLTTSIGTYVHTSRWDLLNVALQQRASHICWIDADMRFPRDAIIRLLKHNKKVVGINYCTRGLPPRYVAIKQIGVPDSNVVTGRNQSGLEQVEAIGFGFVLMRVDALKDLDFNGQPLFAFKWMQDRKSWMGEDVYFCQKLKEAGVPIHVDHDLSKECRHVGLFEFSTEHVEEWYDPDANGEAKEPLIVMP